METGARAGCVSIFSISSGERGGESREEEPIHSRDPVEILIPRDITDPLNLNSGIADSSCLVSPYKSGGKRRHRNRHHGVSLRISRGPIAAPPLTEVTTPQPGHFPSNVSFVKANYVLEKDHLLVTQRPEYDVILCLSVTKWVHLNWGDDGLKRLFKRAYRHLRPGGIFILEPQPWESYGRKKKLTDVTYRNYRNISLKPEQFTSYLTNEVGFTSYQYLGAPKTAVKGFQRPIYLFNK
uniref:RNA methyltransferase n=1 Tax=Knipowitschia caucasica TaxID=637954 RepID=A0AAV2J7Y7_KNICA